jgi:hypothetical protein
MRRGWRSPPFEVVRRARPRQEDGASARSAIGCSRACIDARRAGGLISGADLARCHGFSGAAETDAGGRVIGIATTARTVGIAIATGHGISEHTINLHLGAIFAKRAIEARGLKGTGFA